MDKKYEHVKILLGSGTYGEVHQGRNRMTGELVALKKVAINVKTGLPATSIKEIAALKLLNHPNIVNLIEAELTDTQLTYVFEFCDRDLRNYMRGYNKPLEPNTVLSFMHQFLTGMAYCHGKNIIHRDLKPDNLLINSNLELKIADFGLARQTDLPVKTLNNIVTTCWYRAPEILLGSCTYGLPIDIWSIGCIFFEMMYSRPRFRGNEENQLLVVLKNLGTPSYMELQRMFQSHPGIQDEKLKKLPLYPKTPTTIPPTYPEDAGRLLQRLLRFDPEARVTAVDALRHSYFRELRSMSSSSNNRKGNEPVSTHTQRSSEHVGSRSQPLSAPRPPIYSQQQHQPATNAPTSKLRYPESSCRSAQSKNNSDL